MEGKTRCAHCRKTFTWYRSDTQIKERNSLPRFCGHECRLKHGGTGFRPGGTCRISEMTEEQKLDKIKKSFEKNVIKKEGCWGWSGRIKKDGYAQMSLNIQYGVTVAHRASWIIHKGPIPKGMHVCHACDDRKCSNPACLWLGTAKQNNDDKISKDRSNNVPPPIQRGSKCWNAKLNEEKVKEINDLIRKGIKAAEIGRRFGVNRDLITKIKNGDTWKHVT